MNARAQLGVRKNPASSRQHGLRLAVDSSSLQSQNRQSGPLIGEPSEPSTSCIAGTVDVPVPDTHNEITENTRESGQLLTVAQVADLLQVPVSWVYEHTRPTCRSPLPRMKVGKYLRFLASDITAYVEAMRDHSRVPR